MTKTVLDFEPAYERVLREWNEKAGRGSDISRFFFFAGAQLGLEIAFKAYGEVERTVLGTLSNEES